MNNKPSRKRIGQPISITLTLEQIAWIMAQVQPGETKMTVIRQIIQEAMDKQNSAKV